MNTVPPAVPDPDDGEAFWQSLDQPPTDTPPVEAEEVRPVRPGQQVEVVVYPAGDQPLMWVYVAGCWRTATVLARQRTREYVAYQVAVILVEGHGSMIRMYRWGTPAMRVLHRPKGPGNNHGIVTA